MTAERNKSKIISFFPASIDFFRGRVHVFILPQMRPILLTKAGNRHKEIQKNKEKRID
ncbi:hypothetical protein AB434_0981 [Heyndrickxia coagulans]|nr:hypothetical protein AB434_0981 [Heyndrickxia coagulans]